MRALRSEHVPFDPRTSHRTFNFCVVDAGLIKLLPPLVDRLLNEAPNVRLSVLQLEAEHLESWLESGKLDFAMGSFPVAHQGRSAGSRCGSNATSAWCAQAIRASRADPTLRAFAAEKHVLVSIVGSGHAHQPVERALEAAIPPENIICRMPMFIGAAVLAKHTDAVATLPMSIATVLAQDLDLQIITPPIKLPKIDIYQYWHDRLHREPGNQVDSRHLHETVQGNELQPGDKKMVGLLTEEQEMLRDTAKKAAPARRHARVYPQARPRTALSLRTLRCLGRGRHAQRCRFRKNTAGSAAA